METPSISYSHSQKQACGSFGSLSPTNSLLPITDLQHLTVFPHIRPLNMSTPTPSLQGMPTEILDSIVIELIKIDNKKRDSLRSLAMVSRKMNDCALPELFREKTIACRQDAMDSLIEVSNSERLRHHVKHLTVNFNFSGLYYAVVEWEYDAAKALNTDLECLELFCEHLKCQQGLFQSKAGSTFLVHCLQRLTQVHTVILNIDRHSVWIPEISEESPYDIPIATWPERVVNPTAAELFKQVREDELTYGLFGTFLEAMSTANLNRQLHSEHGVGIQTLHFHRAIPETALVMSPATLHHSKLAFSGLKEVCLDIDAAELLRTHNIPSTHKTLRTDVIYELLESADGLVRLELVTSHERIERRVNGGYYRVEPRWSLWLGIFQEGDCRVSALQLFVGRKCWPRLQIISFSGMIFHEVEFVDFILRHAETIREISCTGCHLLTGSWEGAIAALAGQIPEVVKFDILNASDANSIYPMGSRDLVYNNYTPLSTGMVCFRRPINVLRLWVKLTITWCKHAINSNQVVSMQR